MLSRPFQDHISDLPRRFPESRYVEPPRDLVLLRKLSTGSSGSGSYVLEKKTESFVIRKRHYPVVVALFATAVLGPLIFMATKALETESKRGGALMGIVVGMALWLTFVIFFFYLEKQPALLRWLPFEGVLMIRGQEVAKGLNPLCLGTGPAVCRVGGGVGEAEVLYAIFKQDEGAVPLAVDSMGGGQIRRVLLDMRNETPLNLIHVGKVDLLAKSKAG